MKMKIGLIALLLSFGPPLSAQAKSQKTRVIVLTDIENEPDDAMSMVRFLTYANQFDIEGLVATTSVHQQNKLAAWRISEIVAAYGKVRDNLNKHEAGYPSESFLKSLIKEGRADYGMRAVGDDKDSEGSDHLIECALKADDRPLWILVWGGPNCLAQALWKIKKTFPKDAADKMVAKLRVYTISDQDDSGPWIRKNFPSLFYIASPGIHSLGGYHYATWTGISGDHFHGRFAGANFDVVKDAWLDEHIRIKGPLGKEYPHVEYLMEGDSPSFMYLIDNGLGNAEQPDWGSWGGRYEFYQPRTEKWFSESESRPFWTNAKDEVLGKDGFYHTGNKETIWRWREAFQNDFSARMDWTIKPFKESNHPPLVALATEKMIHAKPGEIIRLDASKSSDPDGDDLDFNWFYYPEPGTFTVSSGKTGQQVTIKNHNESIASLEVPTRFGRPGTMHIILAVTDHGTPAFTRYARIVVDVTE